MAPKKNKATKMDLGTFLTDEKLGSWADEMEDMPVYSRTGYGGNSERRTFNSTTNTYGGSGSGGYSVREELPLPSKPPYIAHLGNLSFDATIADVTDFFADCDCKSVRIIEDKEQMKPKGFGYAEFNTLDGLKKALTLSQSPFQGRNIRISIADPPKQSDRPDARELTDWSRKGPLPDLPNRGGSRNVSDRFGSGRGGGFNDAGSEMGERRREYQPDDGKVRDFSNWERKGPLSPLPQADRPSQSRDGGRPRTNDGPRNDTFRERRDSPAAWGEGRGQGSQEGSRPPRREFQERPVVERAPTAAEQDNQWRSKMRPDPPAAQSTAPPSREGSEAPASPAMAPSAPVGRPKLNLAKRTVSEAVPDQPSPSLTGEAKPSPFGAARPIDTAAKEKEIEEKRLAAIREKKEADEAAKEEKRVAKEAARLEKEKEDANAAESKTNGAAAPDAEKVEILQREGTATDANESKPTNGAAENEKTAESKETSPDAPKAKAEMAGAWRRPSGGPPRGPANDSPREYSNRGDFRGGRGGRGGGSYRGRGNDGGNFDRRQDSRGPKQNGSSAPAVPASPATESESAPQDEDGWSTVQKPNKNKRGGAARA